MTRHTFEARKGKYHPDNGLAGNEWMKTFSNQVGPEWFTDAIGTVRPAAWFRVSGRRDDAMAVDCLTEKLVEWLIENGNREDGERCPSALVTSGRCRITVTPKGREAGFSSPPKVVKEWSWLAPRKVLDALGGDAWRSKTFATKGDAIASGIGNIGWTLQCRQVTPWETCGVMREVEIRNKIMPTSQGGPWQTMGEVVPNPASLRIDEPIKETGDE